MSCGLLPLSASGRGLGGGVIAAAFCLPLLDPAAVRPVDFAFRPHQPQHVSCRRTTAQRIAEEEQLAMASWQRRIGFKVDVAGIIEIMGSSLYSRSDTPIRELIQNAHDAVQRRRKKELSYLGRIDIEQDRDRHILRFHDDGIGLTVEEAEKYLGTLGIGITGMLKKGQALALPPEIAGDGDSLIGQFGVGLFSAFMLAERVVVESRRLDAAEGVRWEAGAGTDIEISAGDRAEAGTTVTLHLKPEYHKLAAQHD